MSMVADNLFPAILLRRKGTVEYEATWRAMQAFTNTRSSNTPDEIWLLQHPPTYTVGVAGRDQHLPRGEHQVPIVRVDRGGQITYHGPGQWLAYCLFDLRRRGLTVRALVRRMEQTVIDLVQTYGIVAQRRDHAPGVYVEGAKIAALGLRVHSGCCYHGLALNVNMDLAPFDRIDPCGYAGLQVTDLLKLGVTASMESVGDKLLEHLTRQFDGAAAS